MLNHFKRGLSRLGRPFKRNKAMTLLGVEHFAPYNSLDFRGSRTAPVSIRRMARRNIPGVRRCCSWQHDCCSHFIDGAKDVVHGRLYTLMIPIRRSMESVLLTASRIAANRMEFIKRSTGSLVLSFIDR